MRSYKLHLLICLFFISNISIGQKLVSADYIGTMTKEELIEEFGNPLIQYGVDLYKMLYETNDINGALDTASGLFIYPDKLENTYPMLISQHGTVGSRWDVPSNLQGGYQLPLILASMGYVTTAADYLGLGEARGHRQFVHLRSEAMAGIDMLFAAKEFVDNNGLFVNDQLFVTGYSQGGHAAMAAHKVIEEEYAGQLTVTASAPMSGPYSLSEKMFEFSLGDTEYGFISYLVAVLVSMENAYGNIVENQDYTSWFKPQYGPYIEQYLNEEIDLFTLNDFMIAEVVADVGASIPKYVFKDEISNAVLTEPDHPLNVALRLNDTYDWAPKAPTRLYYCTQDEQVTFENSLLAEEVMTQNGALDVSLKNSGDVDHGTCVFPSLLDAIFWFASFQDITSDTKDIFGKSLTLSVYPNPASEIININLPSEDDWQLVIYDVLGKRMMTDRAYASSNHVMKLDLPGGQYYLQATNGNVSEIIQLVLK